jgi:pimeloyl-ACP methyl ester carboxylesterase
MTVSMSASTLVSHMFSTPRQTTHFLESGPTDGPLMIFLHGWPCISLMWRAQMDAFAADCWHRPYAGSAALEAGPR